MGKWLNSCLEAKDPNGLQVYLAEQARLEAIEKAALSKYAAEKAAKEAGFSPTRFSAPATSSGFDRNDTAGFSETGANQNRVRVDGYHRRDGT